MYGAGMRGPACALAVAGCVATAPAPMIATATTQETIVVVRDPLSGEQVVWFPRLPAPAYLLSD